MGSGSATETKFYDADGKLQAITTFGDAVYEGPGGCYLWDTEMAGFGVRIYPTGRKSFVVSYWTKGRRRFYTLGPFGELTLHQAKSEALEVFLRARRGEDPVADRRASRTAPKMTDLADRHIEEHAKIKNKPQSVKRDRCAWDRCVLPKLGRFSFTLCEIQPAGGAVSVA